MNVVRLFGAKVHASVTMWHTRARFMLLETWSTQGGFITSALRAISVTLCKGNAIMYRASLGMQARASGRAYQAGLPVPVPAVE